MVSTIVDPETTVRILVSLLSHSGLRTKWCCSILFSRENNVKSRTTTNLSPYQFFPSIVSPRCKHGGWWL